jgi:predicted transcriptional regulator
MTNGGRVVTADLPAGLVSRLDELAERIDRSRSWIIRQALNHWLADEEQRHEMSLDEKVG